MWESTFFVDFQELWEEWDGLIVPRFPSARHFHRRRRLALWFVLFSVHWARVLLVSTFLAVRLDLWFVLLILVCLDDREGMAEPFVLDNRRVADTLVFAEDAVGKRKLVGSNLKPAVRELL